MISRSRQPRAERDALVVDVIASKSLKVLDTFGTEQKAPPAVYKRIRLPLAGSKHIEMLTLWDEDCEFPRLDPGPKEMHPMPAG